MTIRILLADSHASMRESLRALINRQPDMEVVGEVENGRIMSQLSRSFKPDVVVMDVDIADQKGTDAVRRLTDSAPGMKILALSMHSNQQFVDEMINAGARGYLLKDRAFEELASAIHTVADDHIYMYPGIEDPAAPESGS